MIFLSSPFLFCFQNETNATSGNQGTNTSSRKYGIAGSLYDHRSRGEEEKKGRRWCVEFFELCLHLPT